MRVLHATMQNFGGGAAIAAKRLHLALCDAGIDSHMAVASIQGESKNTTLLGGCFSRRVLNPLALRAQQAIMAHCFRRPEHPAYTTFSLLPSLQHRRLNALTKGILHLHWLGGGFLSLWALTGLCGPVVWTMHDTWPFTGGCHFTATECTRYKERCGRCPELCSERDFDLSRLHWILKRRAVERVRPVIVSPSREYARRAQGSGMLQGCVVKHIPNGIDTTLFRPIPQEQARAVLGIPRGVSVILFGAAGATTDYNKGFDLLVKALRHFADKENVLPIVFGSAESAFPLPVPARYLGYLHDAISLSVAYSAADVFVCPSRQENLPNTVMESLACGTPVVAFPVGGVPDMVEHGVSGYLATPYDTEDLARGIALLLGDAELRHHMGAAGRAKVEQEFAMPIVAQKYITLYEDILSGHKAEKHA